jgi:predicted TIM-barrel fold metal-dependent hydrolase
VKESFPTRRTALASIAGLAAGTVLAGRARAQTSTLHGLIDVHHHFYPPPLVAAANAYGAKRGIPPAGGPIGAWTPDRTLAEMDANGIATAVLSLASSGGVWFDQPPAQWAPLARACNDYAAGMMRDHPGRFGLFATLPMPDVDAALKEIAYAFDTLRADGISLPTSWGDRWPGDPAFAPVWDELNRRKAIVVFHPMAPNCCTGALVANAAESYIEYPYDTGRAVESLLFSGTFATHRDVRWTFCHGGGPVPVLAGRIATLSRAFRQKNLDEVAPDGVVAELQRLYYDTANATYAPSMAALLAFVPSTQILFGTDYPYVSGKINVDNLVARNLPPATLAAIANGNAQRLIPRLRS